MVISGPIPESNRMSQRKEPALVCQQRAITRETENSSLIDKRSVLSSRTT